MDEEIDETLESTFARKSNRWLIFNSQVESYNNLHGMESYNIHAKNTLTLGADFVPEPIVNSSPLLDSLEILGTKTSGYISELEEFSPYYALYSKEGEYCHSCGLELNPLNSVNSLCLTCDRELIQPTSMVRFSDSDGIPKELSLKEIRFFSI